MHGKAKFVKLVIEYLDGIASRVLNARSHMTEWLLPTRYGDLRLMLPPDQDGYLYTVFGLFLEPDKDNPNRPFDKQEKSLRLD